MSEDINPTTIILNRMYTGDYLGKNIGHEVINLIQSDNGNYYIYINAYGSVNDKFYNPEYEEKNDVILFTRYVTVKGIKDTVEILAMATDLKLCAKEDIWSKVLNSQKEEKAKKKTKIEKAKQINKCINNYIKNENIKYNKVPIEDIFNENNYDGINNDISRFVTYKAAKLYKPTKCIYLSKDELSKEAKSYLEKGEEGIVFCLNNEDNDSDKKFQPYGTELKTYFTKTGKENAYDKLLKIINDESSWETMEECTTQKLLDKRKDEEYNRGEGHNFIDIINKADDEVIFSNFICYIFGSLKKEVKGFFHSKNINLSENFEIKREEGNIDILIKDRKNHNLIVIENKIKAGIHGEKSENETEKLITNQLHKYIHYTYGEIWSSKKYIKIKEDNTKYEQMQEYLEDAGIYNNRYFYILLPDYNHLDIDAINNEIEGFEKNSSDKRKDKYKLIHYSKLLEFFQKLQDTEKGNIPYFKDFLNAIERHSHKTNNIQERQMFERFAHRIEELNKLKQGNI